MMKHFPDLPPIWLLGAMAVSWLLAVGMPLVVVFGPIFRLFGVLLAIAGMVLILWSAIWFARKKTTIEPHHAPKVLIVEGPYRYSRNPIYLGMLAILSGFVLWLGALGPALVPFVFAGILSKRFIEPEEARLLEAFGPEARRYLDRTRRWL